MGLEPFTDTRPIFKWLDWLVAEYGRQLMILAVYLAPFLIIWILNGGCWRQLRELTQEEVARVMAVMKRTSRACKKPKSGASAGRDDDSQWFSA